MTVTGTQTVSLSVSCMHARQASIVRYTGVTSCILKILITVVMIEHHSTVLYSHVLICTAFFQAYHASLYALQLHNSVQVALNNAPGFTRWPRQSLSLS